MKTTFFGYYPPTADQYERLWKDGLIVLDTNVLLNLYRLPTAARDDLINVLELLRERLWIPHQVALEFQRRRLTVISSERKSTEEALGSASDLVAKLKRQVDALQIDKRGLGIESQPLVEDLERANAKLIEAIKAVHQSQPDIASTDPVRAKLDEILAGRVGAGPGSQADLDRLVFGGEERFKEGIPPGFADADKDKNPNEATFIHDHIKYQRKFGDLILWRQLIEHAKSTDTKAVLMVTADKKEDWWWREQGKTIGAHPDLVREIFRDGGVELFWMYSSVQFIEHANKYAAAAVSSESVAELQQVVLSAPDRLSAGLGSPRVDTSSEGVPLRELQSVRFASRFDDDYRRIENSVATWLSRTQGEVVVNPRGFPDFLVRHGDDVHGYEVKFLRDHRMLLSSAIVNTLARGYLETREGRLAEFTMILVMRETNLHDLLDTNRLSQLDHRVAQLLSRYPISAIVVGVILGEDFEPMIVQREPDQGGSSGDTEGS